MKYLVLCLTLSVWACKTTLKIPRATTTFLKKTSVQLNADSFSPEQEGNALKESIQRDYIPPIRRKASASRKTLNRSGVVTTSLGTLSTGVSGLLDDSNKQKNWAFGFSVATTGVGVFQVFKGGSEDYKNFLSDMETAVMQWDVSARDEAAYTAFRSEIGRILARYGDLYEEEPAKP